MIATTEKDGTVDDAQKILKCILKNNFIELKKQLEYEQCVDVLISTRLEVIVNAKAKKFLGKKYNNNVVAEISFAHLAVIERKSKCLAAILDALSQDKSKLNDIINSRIVVLENYHQIKKDFFNIEVFYYKITDISLSFFRIFSCSVKIC